TLTFIERAAYRDGCTVCIVGDRDPLTCLKDSGIPSAELDRWVRALGSFRREIVGVGRATGLDGGTDLKQIVFAETRGIPRLERIATEILGSNEWTTTVSALAAFGSAAAPYYQSLWNTCTVAERLALRHLAEEGVVNPQ